MFNFRSVLITKALLLGTTRITTSLFTDFRKPVNCFTTNNKITFTMTIVAWNFDVDYLRELENIWVFVSVLLQSEHKHDALKSLRVSCLSLLLGTKNLH